MNDCSAGQVVGLGSEVKCSTQVNESQQKHRMQHVPPSNWTSTFPRVSIINWKNMQSIFSSERNQSTSVKLGKASQIHCHCFSPIKSPTWQSRSHPPSIRCAFEWVQCEWRCVKWSKGISTDFFLALLFVWWYARITIMRYVAATRQNRLMAFRYRTHKWMIFILDNKRNPIFCYCSLLNWIFHLKFMRKSSVCVRLCWCVWKVFSRMSIHRKSSFAIFVISPA